MPLEFLPGGRLAGWHRGAWAATFALAFFLLVEVLVLPGAPGNDGGAR
ncbi:MAG: hypothetical protein M3N21_00240 [Actinomycetota bacterium]|nr:hypothetical protein [Actinomycetota bacterium]